MLVDAHEAGATGHLALAERVRPERLALLHRLAEPTVRHGLLNRVVPLRHQGAPGFDGGWCRDYADGTDGITSHDVLPNTRRKEKASTHLRMKLKYKQP